MKISEFSNLSTIEQIELFADRAVYLARRVEKDAVYILFDCLGLYMEVTVKMDNNLVESVLIFEYDNALNRYLEDIPIEDILSDLNLNRSADQ